MRRLTHKTRRLVLRPYRATDYEAWFAAWTGAWPAQNRFDAEPLSTSAAGRRRFQALCARQARLASEDRLYVYGVFTKSTGELIGYVDLFVMVRDHFQMGSLGYRIFNRHWGQGYGREAVAEALQIGLKNLGLQRIELSIEPKNTRSLKLARALRLKSEGLRRRYVLDEKKGWLDVRVYSATRAT
jgi:ribosomal-protein-alanine N-acetyltransferase